LVYEHPLPPQCVNAWKPQSVNISAVDPDHTTGQIALTLTAASQEYKPSHYLISSSDCQISYID
jgi:hypothetical protein